VELDIHDIVKEVLTSSQCALIGKITFIVERIIVGEFYLHTFQFSDYEEDFPLIVITSCIYSCCLESFFYQFK